VKRDKNRTKKSGKRQKPDKKEWKEIADKKG